MMDTNTAIMLVISVIAGLAQFIHSGKELGRVENRLLYRISSALFIARGVMHVAEIFGIVPPTLLPEGMVLR